MKNEIKIFESPEFGRIRTVTDERGEPWFCLADVCKVLGLQRSAVMRRLEKGVISSHPLSTKGGRQLIAFVNEDGLYDVILDSRKPSARDFRKWVTSEVLPQIRKMGGYIPLHEDDDEKTILAKAVTILQRTLKQKDDLLEAQRPKVEFAEAVTTGDGCILMSEIAKLLTRYGVTKRYIVTCYNKVVPHVAQPSFALTARVALSPRLFQPFLPFLPFHISSMHLTEEPLEHNYAVCRIYLSLCSERL